VRTDSTTNLPSRILPCHLTFADLIQAALLVCGIMTFIQVTGLRWRTSQYQWGAGILSVMGISFASVPLFTTVITQQMVGVT
jgi:xanthine/uracil permease